jgi:hypothetical protein
MYICERIEYVCVCTSDGVAKAKYQTEIRKYDRNLTVNQILNEWFLLPIHIKCSKNLYFLYLHLTVYL